MSGMVQLLPANSRVRVACSCPSRFGRDLWCEASGPEKGTHLMGQVGRKSGKSMSRRCASVVSLAVVCALGVPGTAHSAVEAPRSTKDADAPARQMNAEEKASSAAEDRKSTRLNSSHVKI